jgi:hypothetical protein
MRFEKKKIFAELNPAGMRLEKNEVLRRIRDRVLDHME